MTGPLDLCRQSLSKPASSKPISSGLNVILTKLTTALMATAKKTHSPVLRHSRGSEHCRTRPISAPLEVPVVDPIRRTYSWHWDESASSFHDFCAVGGTRFGPGFIGWVVPVCSSSASSMPQLSRCQAVSTYFLSFWWRSVPETGPITL